MTRLSQGTLVAGLQEGDLPTKTDLAVAPFLESWALEEVAPGLFRLVGVVTGHPLLANGWCSTSVLLFIDADCAWARTVSRLYRLGRPLAGDLVTSRQRKFGRTWPVSRCHPLLPWYTPVTSSDDIRM